MKSKVKLFQLLNPAIADAVNELAKAELPAQVWYTAHDFLLKFNEEGAKKQKFQKELLERFAKKNEKGEVEYEIDEKNPSVASYKFENTETQGKFMCELNDYLMVEVEVEQIQAEILKDVKIKGEILLPLMGVLIAK